MVLNLLFLFPPRGKADHEGVEFREQRIDAALPHDLVAHLMIGFILTILLFGDKLIQIVQKGI